MTEIMGKNRSLKILQVISTPPFAWGTGGPAKVVYELSIQLAKLGNEVNILTTDMYKPTERFKIKKQEYYEGISIIRFKNFSNFLAWKYKIYFSWGLMKFLKHNVKEYDIVHLQDIISVHAIATYYYCKLYQIPYLITPHGSVSWLNGNGLFKKVYKIIAYKILNHASIVIPLNRTEYGLCLDMGLDKNKLKIVPNGIFLREADIEIKKGFFKKKYNIENDCNIILYLGRIHETKGLDLLVLSFSKLIKDLNKSKLVIVGPDDGYLSKLIELVNKLGINNHVIFTGPIYNNEKDFAYIDADVFVTPNYAGFPMTFIESCSFNTPIITTEKGDSLDWINNKVGFVVKYDQDNLTKAIHKILSDDVIRKDFEINCQDIIKENFTWEIIAKKLEKLYLSMVDK